MGLFGGIEAGGTKFVCAVGTGPDDVREEIRYPTTTPEASIAKAVAFFRKIEDQGESVEAIGVASFGPLDPDPTSPTFGYVTSTPKPGWANTDFVGLLRQAFDVPVGFDTDVNAAAFGEYKWGAGQGLASLVYLTVGTGIGGGAVVNGRMLHGLMHPEMGHIMIRHDWESDPFPGICPYHGDCLEGLACGPALEARWGQRAETLPPDHRAWTLEAHYLALGVVSFILTLVPQRIILGGGVMQQPHLLPKVRKEVQNLLNGYFRSPMILDRIDETIVPPQLGNKSGVLGAIALAQLAAADRV